MSESPRHVLPASTTATVHMQGILFDMDGVLISSIGSVVRCWRQWCRMHDVPGADTFEVPHGKRAVEIIRSLRPDMDAEAGLRIIEDMEIADVADLQVLPGVTDLLSSIPPHRWCIVTSATRRLLLGRLEAAGLPVPDRIVAAEDVTLGKPSPEPYQKGAEMLGFRPEQCLVVEDAPAGVAAGVAAGCCVLGVLGTHTPEALKGSSWITPGLQGVQVRASEIGLTITLQSLR